ncbi:hypothetical protein ACFT7S_27435 [Streptomyces sp. NPDC057136]|uniref:hypothetical protein n=1 Tax=Streptomyces sp. NPDC057136 TaxID=3346029 RepID=UPI0036259428
MGWKPAGHAQRDPHALALLAQEVDCIPREHRELVAALRARDTDTALDPFAAHRRHAVDVVTGTTAPR